MIVAKLLLLLLYLRVSYTHFKWLLKEEAFKDKAQIHKCYREYYQSLHAVTVSNLTSEESRILVGLITIILPLLAGVLGSDMKLLIVAGLLSFSSIIFLILDLWTLKRDVDERFSVFAYYTGVLDRFLEVAFTVQMFIVFFMN